MNQGKPIRRVTAPLRIDFAGGWTDVPIYAKRYGGAVLNAAISIHVNGNAWSNGGCSTSMLSCLAPRGSGLGMSGAMAVAFLALTGRDIESRNDRFDLAEAAFELEKLQGTVGGKQDQHAAAYGGVNYFTFDTDTGVRSYPSDLAVLALLESRLVLCYSGQTRMSSKIHSEVWEAFESNDGDTREALHELREIAAMADGYLRVGNLGMFAECIGRNWDAQKRLHASVTNEAIDGIFAAATNAGAVSGKACGAGGGGCLVFFCEPDARDSVKAAVESAGAKAMDFRFDYEGVQVTDAPGNAGE